MAFDPNVFQNLPALIKMQGVQRTLQNTPGGSPEDIFASITARTLSTGHFADAYKRMGLTPPVLVAGLDTTAMHPNVKAGASTGNAAQDAMLKEVDSDDFNRASVTPGATTRPTRPTPSQGIGIVHTDSLYTPEEKRKRLGSARPKVAPSDPFEGMDADLRKAMEAEDRRLKK